MRAGKRVRAAYAKARAEEQAQRPTGRQGMCAGEGVQRVVCGVARQQWVRHKRVRYAAAAAATRACGAAEWQCLGNAVQGIFIEIFIENR